MEFKHVSVLRGEVVKLLALNPGDVVVDGTLGGGGHAEAILEAISPGGQLLGIDADPNALEAAELRLKRFGEEIILVKSNYREVESYLEKYGLDNISAFLLDLGLSSHELETADRGFSFLKEGPLDMRFSSDQELTAGEIVNSWPPEKLEDLFRRYGDEKFAKRIAFTIAAKRRDQEIATTTALAALIKNAVPRTHDKIHPATRVFQALRIATNDELGALQEVLPKFVRHLKPGGKIAIISFHSLEDRIVKQFFVEEEKAGRLRRVTKKPVVPSPDETAQNPRARSAKLRVAEKTGGGN
ncbi:MAG: 16S rRNA (cytosine(1402)-N(4))-methyltransferase RsmH [bacterium]